MSEVRLFVIGGRDVGRTFVLDDASETVIGREPACDVRLSDKSISRRHARVFLDDDLWVLEDLGSRNGVLRDAVRVERTVLEDGDEISLGEVPLRFRLAPARHVEPASAVPSASEPEDSGFEEIELEEEIELHEPIRREASPTPVATRGAGAPRPPAREPSVAEPSVAGPSVAEPRERYAQVLGERSSVGWLRSDLSQYPLWVRLCLALVLIALGVGVFLLAFRGVQVLRG